MNRSTTSDETVSMSEHDDQPTDPDTEAEDGQELDGSPEARADAADEARPRNPGQAAHDDPERDPAPAESGDPDAAEGRDDAAADGAASRAESATGRAVREGTRRAGWPSALAGRLRLPRTRRARIVSAVVLLLVGATGTGGHAWWAAGRLPDDAVFRLGDRVIGADELDRVTDSWRALYGIQPPQDLGRSDRFRRDAAKAYAVSLILDKAARDRGVVVADKTARDTLSRFVTQQLGAGPQARDQFVQALGNAGTSERDVLDEVKKQLAMTRLFDAVTKGAPLVTGQDVQDAFAERKDRLGTPERRRLANIVVRTEEEATRLVADLRDGSSFDALARRRSLDGATRGEGGDLGARTRSELQSDYAQAAFTAAAGQVFGPVRNQFGWNIGKVVKIMPPVPPVFDQVREQLRQQLQLEKSLQTWRDWLAGRIRDAHVEYADAYRPEDPGAPPAVRPGRPGMPEGQRPETPR